MSKVAASITIHNIEGMSKTGRKAICNWIRRLAKHIEKEPKSFAKTFRARYFHTG